MDNNNLKEDKDFRNLIEDELNIYNSIEVIKSKTLEELYLTRPEIDLFLNKFEDTYDVYLEEWELNLEIKFGDFMKKLLNIINGN
ncbi:hypothetical protein [Salinimicrobium oceani]|uniref:Uncharacterized protein n=1 Tax=Salinimicrobium oceani TaxID=2722702 RepID=A0ABX1CZ26_9FLAO|nr:hypothetical protein [Salinimicrobium oceani]NJW53524.1 hypothetical protein [Salinimicrobium oceani]